MSPAELLAELPDDHPVSVPGVGECTVLELVRARGGEETPGVSDEWEATLAMYAWKATRNLCIVPQCPGDGPQDGKA